MWPAPALTPRVPTYCVGNIHTAQQHTNLLCCLLEGTHLAQSGGNEEAVRKAGGVHLAARLPAACQQRVLHLHRRCHASKRMHSSLAHGPVLWGSCPSHAQLEHLALQFAVDVHAQQLHTHTQGPKDASHMASKGPLAAAGNQHK